MWPAFVPRTICMPRFAPYKGDNRETNFDILLRLAIAPRAVQHVCGKTDYYRGQSGNQALHCQFAIPQKDQALGRQSVEMSLQRRQFAVVR